ncbi:MAG: hypothetical protein V4557_09640 [Bacteroidota bacterium]
MKFLILFLLLLMTSQTHALGVNASVKDTSNSWVNGLQAKLKNPDQFSFDQPGQIHIHTDKEVYLRGETIWYKVYLMEGYLPDSSHTNLYVELVDEMGIVFQRAMLPIGDATANGNFVLADSLKSGFIFIRAYTENTSPDLIYVKQVSVILKTKQPDALTRPVQSSLQFFPEGGNFINNVANQLAFKSNLSDGTPFPIKAFIKTAGGTVIDSIESVHDGMGSVSITPNGNEHYYAEWIDHTGAIKQTALPTSANKGITLHTEQVNNYLYYVIQEPEGSPDSIYIKASMHEKEIYTATVSMANTPIVSGRIPLASFPTGILQLTAYDNNKRPIAERINFINNHFQFKIITSATKNVGKRQKNTIEIEISDTLYSNLSLSVYDVNFKTNQTSNIYTDLLLGNNIKGDIADPAWYFADSSLERKKALDLVMQTNGWRRYISNPSEPVNENYITLSGIVTDAKGLPQAKQSLSFLLQQKDSSRQVYSAVTDDKGRFTQSGLVYYDTATIWYQSKKKEVALNVRFDPVFNKYSNAQPHYIPIGGTNKTFVASVFPPQFVTQETADGFTEKGHTLKGVTVKSRQWRNNPMLLMDEKYTSGIFRGNATAFTFDVMNDPMTNAKGDVMNYLLGKVPGLSLGYPKGRTIGGLKKLLYRGGPLTLIFIDEQPFLFDPSDPAAYSEIQSLNIDDIAYIKFFNRYPLQPDKAALAIYLKKGDEISSKDIRSGLPKIKVPGYTITKEFYSPDYSFPDTRHSGSDSRTTLFWQPYIILDKSNHKATITFYNNDISTSLYLVIEGMNEAGKLVHMEQLISEKN